MQIRLHNTNGEREVKGDQLALTISQIAHMAKTNPSIGRVDFYDNDQFYWRRSQVRLEGLGGRPEEWRLIPCGIEGEGYFTPCDAHEAALIIKLIFMGQPASLAAFAACFPHLPFVAKKA